MEISVPTAGRHYLLACVVSLSMLATPAMAPASNAVTFCFNDWPPYTQMGDQEASGITVEIVRVAAEMLGREARFVERAWDECLQTVKDGEVDVVLDAAKRDAYLQGPTSFNSYTDTFWVRNDSKINSYDQLSGGRIALVEGYNYGAKLFEHIDDLGLEIVRGVDDPTNIRDLAAGKVDVVIADLASTFVITNDNNLQVHPILPPFSLDLLYPSFNRELVELQREFDRAFAILIDKGVVDEIYEKHIGTTYSSFSRY